MGYPILILDSSQPPDGKLGELFARCGFAPRIANDVDGAARWLGEHPQASVVVRIADARAVDLCRSLRMVSAAPIVCICAEPDEDLVVRCLEAGADTALAAPVSRRELAARIGAVLGRQNVTPPAQPPSDTYRIGDLVVDAAAHIVTNAGRPLSLTPTEFRLLLALARRRGEMASNAELVSEVWGTSDGEGSDCLRLYVRYLRQKLGDARRQPRLLLNQRGIGYRLVKDATGNGRLSTYGDHEAATRLANAGARSPVRARRALAASRG